MRAVRPTRKGFMPRILPAGAHGAPKPTCFTAALLRKPKLWWVVSRALKRPTSKPENFAQVPATQHQRRRPPGPPTAHLGAWALTAAGGGVGVEAESGAECPSSPQGELLESSRCGIPGGHSETLCGFSLPPQRPLQGPPWTPMTFLPAQL